MDADGLAALSMRRLAAELGVDPMAAYRHVPNKEALLDAVVDAVLAEVELPAGTGPWEERLSVGVHRVLAAMTAHPHATPLLSARKWLTPAGLAIIEWGLHTLTSGGVDPRRAVLVMNATGLFLTGLAQAMTGLDGSEPLTALRATPDAYPVTLAALASGEGRFVYPDLLDFWIATALAGLRTPPDRLSPASS